MEAHEQLIAWAEAKGVKIQGIKPQRLPGRGIGIVATRSIRAHEDILEVPTACIRSIDTVPKSIVRALPKDLPIHGVLAAHLALDQTGRFDVWNAVCPTRADFNTMPMVWPGELQALLPGPAAKLLAGQLSKFRVDWAAASAAFPDKLTSEDDYLYAWMLVNTRTFYWNLSPKLKKRSRDDHMVLQPVADLFNHAAEGCNVAFDRAGFTVKALQAYEEGDEINISYGRHSGDFLLTEYGFVMEGNTWDEVSLDEAVLPRLEKTTNGKKLKDRLEDVGFLGSYVLDRETVCHRTQVALRSICLGPREWKRFVDGDDDGESSQPKVDALLVEILEDYRTRVDAVIKQAEALDIGEQEQRAALVDRWKQISDITAAAIGRLSSSSKSA